MPEFPPVFIQKIFCFVQIPESFVQKHTTATGETEGNIEDFFSKQAQIIKSKREIKKRFRQKNKTFILQLLLPL